MRQFVYFSLAVVLYNFFCHPDHMPALRRLMQKPEVFKLDNFFFVDQK